jgi:hypothetical protein
VEGKQIACHGEVIPSIISHGNGKPTLDIVPANYPLYRSIVSLVVHSAGYCREGVGIARAIPSNFCRSYAAVVSQNLRILLANLFPGDTAAVTASDAPGSWAIKSAYARYNFQHFRVRLQYPSVL